MRTKYDEKNRRLTAYPEGEIDQSSSAELRRELDEMIKLKRGLEVFALDLSGVSFMDSSGIGLILGRYRLLKRLGCRLEIRNSRPNVEKVLRISGIGSICEDGKL